MRARGGDENREKVVIIYTSQQQTKITIDIILDRISFLRPLLSPPPPPPIRTSTTASVCNPFFSIFPSPLPSFLLPPANRQVSEIDRPRARRRSSARLDNLPFQRGFSSTQQQTTTTTSPPPAASKPSKTTPCCSKIGLKRGPWTPEEDELLSDYIKREGEGRWRTLPKRAGLLRCGKSCRLRWMNYLRPCVKRGQIAPDEEDLILRLHRLLGNRWSLIAGRIPGRTDNEIKNYWNTHLSKKLISQGIDPRTHKPLDNTNPPITITTTTTTGCHNSNTKRSNNIVTNPNTFPTTPQNNNTTMPQIASSPLDESNNVSSTTGDGTTGDTTTTTTTPSQIILNNANNNNNKTPPIHNNINVSYQHPYLINPSSNLHLSSSTGLVWVTQPHPLSPSNGGSAIEDDDQLLPHLHQQQQQVHHEDHELNYCTDEVFSSFLNSLINEDMFTAPAPPSTTIDHHGSDGLLHNTSSSSSSSPMVMMTTNQVVGFGSFGAAGWDAPPLMSTLSTVVSSYHGGEGEDKTFIYDDDESLRLAG